MVEHVGSRETLTRFGSLEEPPVVTESIDEIVQRIANDQDRAANIALLKAHRREAIARVLATLATGEGVVLAPGVDYRDACDRLLDSVTALGRDDVEYVIALLREELARESEESFSLTWAVAQMNDPATLTVLVSALHHRVADVRWAACVGLRRLRTPEALEHLNAAAADRASDVRGEAVDALLEQGDASSLPILRKRLNDRYPSIQQAAKNAIYAIERRLS